jgi:formamidopyrimidine-DNA glycosylase
MPELPEVETMRRGILPAVGAKIRSVLKLPCPRRPLTITPSGEKFCSLQTNSRIQNIERLGKRVVLVLDNELRVVIEPRMTGLVLISDPPTQEHLRIEWELSSRVLPRFWFWDRRGLGVVRALTPRQFEQYYNAKKIGPDALAISLSDFSERLKRTSRPIKVALLDQALVAGIGNIYASEMLHQASIHPALRSDRLRSAQVQNLYAAMYDVLETAVRYEGSTLGDGTYRNVLNQDGNYQNQHRVYDRAEEICSSCRFEKIVRIVQAQRSTFFCPNCQARKRS